MSVGRDRRTPTAGAPRTAAIEVRCRDQINAANGIYVKLRDAATCDDPSLMLNLARPGFTRSQRPDGGAGGVEVIGDREHLLDGAAEQVQLPDDERVTAA